MRIFNLFVLGILTYTLHCSCVNRKVKPQEIYNQKANEIILQTMKESPCHCMLEIQKESMIEISNAENPRYDIRSFLIEELNTKNNSNLDSLVSISKNFHLDLEKFKMNKIKIVTLKDFLALHNGGGKEILKICPNGIVIIKKPIFDKTFQKSVFDYDFPFSCVKILPPPIYEYKNGRWKRIENKNYR